MFKAIPSPYLVGDDGSFNIATSATTPPDDALSKSKNKQRLADLIKQLSELQHILFAHDHHAILLIFQAMDAAGKDSTIRAVMTGVNPAGCQVHSFKQPSAEELEHDFLWRTSRCLPQRGQIGIFNRSYYEEVLVVRVHPTFLEPQRILWPKKKQALWQERFQSIRDHEQHLARNGTVILKFWLNISKEEQRQRFLSRIDTPHKHWKFNAADIEERAHWDAYMRAYEEALNATSRSYAPWYAIPANNKPFARVCVADILVRRLLSLNLEYPSLTAKARDKFDAMRMELENEAVIK